MSIPNNFWKPSGRRADWIIIADINRHLSHPDHTGLRTRYIALGISIVPPLGQQMISEAFSRSDELLWQTRTQVASWDRYGRLSLFDPTAITEIDYSVGGHGANPIRRVIAPTRDELLPLRYKFPWFERAHARHLQQRGGLRSKDLETGWGNQFCWSEKEFRHARCAFARNAIDVRTDAAVANHQIPQWREPISVSRDPTACSETPTLTIR